MFNNKNPYIDKNIPCKHCDLRKIDCHSKCKKYLSWVEEKEKNKIYIKNKYKEY